MAFLDERGLQTFWTHVIKEIEDNMELMSEVPYDKVVLPNGQYWDGKLGVPVSFTPTLTSGNEIGTLTIDGESTKLYYQGSEISFTQALTSGNEIGTLTIDGKPTKLYYQGSSVNLNGSATQSASFYAPTAAGTKDQVLKSNGSGAPSWTNASWLPLSGGTLSGPLTLMWAASATMDSTTTGPRIIFDQASGGQRVGIVYTSYNDYREPAGLKVIGLDAESSPAWFEVEGKVFATEFSGSGASLTSLNASNISSGTIAAARLPAATGSALGGVKVGSNITVSSGTISLTKDNVTTALGYTPPTTNTTYSNFVKSGSGAKAGLVPAPSTTAGTTKYLREDGTWAVPPDTNTVYTLPNATSSTLGGVKVGSNITVSSGTISLTKANVTAALGYTPPTSDTNTTYSAGTGISLSGTTFSNSGVRSIATGSSNGTISVNTNGTSANVAVKGLGSNAYTSTAYLPLAGGTMTGRLIINYNNDVSVNTATTGALIIGSTTGEHIAIDANEIMAKTNGTTAGVLYLNNEGGKVQVGSGGLYGAVWNDYAEFRSQNETIEPGYITYCDDDGKLKKTTKRLQKYEGVVSDTFGFAIGETDDCKTPLAVSGRALVYCDPEEEHFHSGDCICAGPNGLAYRMTREEVIEFPDRIVGVVSEIPTYKTWGSGNVEVNGRIWIKVK